LTPARLKANIKVVILRFCLVLTILAFLIPLRAQDEPVHMRPEFPLAFPLAQSGRDVTVKYPIMISPTTLIKPGMVLRVMYQLTYDGGGTSDLAVAHHGDMEESYSRPVAGSENQIPPELAHEIEGYRREKWEVANNFILAMAQYPTDAMHLIYSPTGRGQDLVDSRFSFFDGLFVGLPNGKVTVIAVEKESKADAGGIKAGDEIISVGGIPTQDNLNTFAAAYSTAKKVATDNEVASYPMTIRPAGKSDTEQVNIPMPPKITGGLMDGFK
jgi:hypothetical protein